MSRVRRAPASGAFALLAALLALWSALPAYAATPPPLPASLNAVTDIGEEISGVLTVRGGTQVVTVDPKTVTATVGGKAAVVTIGALGSEGRSVVFAIDKSGSMSDAGMASVRAAVAAYLKLVPASVKVGVVSISTTAFVDLAPTTDHALVQTKVDALRSGGDTALYSGIVKAAAALGAKGDRSIIILSDGEDTMASDKVAARAKALAAVTKAGIRVDVVGFKRARSDLATLTAFASAGGGEVVAATDGAGMAQAFTAAARSMGSQVRWTVEAPVGVTGRQKVALAGLASGRPFSAAALVDLGVVVAPTPSASPSVPATVAPSPAVVATPAGWNVMFLGSVVVFAGVLLAGLAVIAPLLRSRRRQRVESIQEWRTVSAPTANRPHSPGAVSGQLLELGERVMSQRESTTRTLVLLDRADLPWRAGEWLLLRVISVLLFGMVGFFAMRSTTPWMGILVGVLIGLFGPSLLLRFLANRRIAKFEAVLPDVLVLVATSLASGFSLPQALDAVARDAAEPAAKEFSRALAETRIGADVSDALERLAVRMDSENMRWATMAIRIQREVGGNLAETLRTTARTLRERESLKRQVRTLSAEGRLSAGILIVLPFGVFLYQLVVSHDYIRLLWTTLPGILMLGLAVVGMLIGTLWMRKLVRIEV